jgi:hypothetical protein
LVFDEDSLVDAEFLEKVDERCHVELLHFRFLRFGDGEPFDK